MESTVKKFYDAFIRLDAEAMIVNYHPDIRFKDPAFGELKGKDVHAMWKMLCESQKGKNFIIEYGDISVEDKMATVTWQAKYSYGKHKRPVRNVIRATFWFDEKGRILKHEDHFDLYKWSKQAMGAVGFLIGWSPVFPIILQNKTGKMLLRYKKQNAEYFNH